MSEQSSDDAKAAAQSSGWEDHKIEQLIRLSKLPLSEKHDWLEEAHRIVRHLQSQKRDNQK
jgi:hypothetical protein